METKVKTLAYEFCTLQAADAFRVVVDKSNGYWDGQTRWRFLVMDADRAYTGKSVMLVADDRTTPARREGLLQWMRGFEHGFEAHKRGLDQQTTLAG
jgi:hypothetical protein